MLEDDVKDSYGKFIGRALHDFIETHSTLRLKDDFFYRDKHGHTWKAPKNFVISADCIPDIAWDVISNPLDEIYHKALAIYAVGCSKREEPWERVHEAFYQAMLASGVPERSAKVMYASVYYFGWHWQYKVEYGVIYFDIVKQAMFTENDFYQLVKDINENNLSIDDIQKYSPSDNLV